MLTTPLCLAFALVAQVAPVSPASLANRFARFDLDGDRVREIEALTPLPWSDAAFDGPRSRAPLVLMFVEERLLASSGGDDATKLGEALARWADDVTREGSRALGFSARVYGGEKHQDGRTLLALRSVAQTIDRECGPLDGIVLVGAFPDALLVRTCNWWRDDPITLRAGKPDAATYDQRRWLRSMPEIVAHTADVVLGDLDGDWESRYRVGPTRLEWNFCIPSGTTQDGALVLTDHESGSYPLTDFFEVDDGNLDLRLETNADGTSRVLAKPRVELRDFECTPRDRKRPNPMALPDVWVSRIDARGVAYGLRKDLLDDAGRPKTTPRPADIDAKSGAFVGYEYDEGFERRLLLRYFARNHAYRTGDLEPRDTVASLACGLPSGFHELVRARAAWSDLDASLDVGGEPDLAAVARWFAAPAILRTIRAHSDPGGSAVTATKDVALLEKDAGGVPRGFVIENDHLRPSLARCGGKLDFLLMRTLYENGVTGSGASFYVHTGCEAISPPNATSLPWSDRGHGAFGGGNAVLFFADGLALIGRAKVFYDEPRGFADALREGRTFGAAWTRYFELESTAASWAEVGDDIGRKRAYFWSVLGDGSLSLRAPTR
ncbi:MAG: hypothetical protein IT459_06995 [Planctomycetes bacterium]|nr:hypothetical protein [Planctomycetota bacterium]